MVGSRSAIANSVEANKNVLQNLDHAAGEIASLTPRNRRNDAQD